MKKRIKRAGTHKRFCHCRDCSKRYWPDFGGILPKTYRELIAQRRKEAEDERKAAIVEQLLAKRRRRFLFTLDSHDYIGPFSNEEAGHVWAKARAISTYTFVPKVPAYSEAHRPW